MLSFTHSTRSSRMASSSCWRKKECYCCSFFLSLWCFSWCLILLCVSYKFCHPPSYLHHFCSFYFTFPYVCIYTDLWWWLISRGEGEREGKGRVKKGNNEDSPFFPFLHPAPSMLCVCLFGILFLLLLLRGPPNYLKDIQEHNKACYRWLQAYVTNMALLHYIHHYQHPFLHNVQLHQSI